MSLAKDRLDASVAALRELTAEATDGRASRARVLGQFVGRAGRRRKLSLAGLCATVLLAIPVASAGLYHGIVVLTRVAPTRAKAPIERPQLRSMFLPPAPPPVELATDVASDTPLAEAHGHDSLAAPAPQSPRLRTASPPDLSAATELAIYERAHRAHFHDGSPRAALRWWNDYLSRFPKGRFRPEAEFNRAVCLVQLGDMEHAREALLRMTAAGGLDSPRDQAEKLLDKLGQP